jgi:hypothetical protein
MRLNLYRTTAVVLAAVATFVVTVPTPASAGGTDVVDIPCPTDPNIRWSKLPFTSAQLGVQYTIISATPTFYASDGRAVDNLLSESVSATFTASQTRTTTITVTTGTSSQLTEKLQYTVSQSIVLSRSTAIGVSVTATVPPRTRMTGLYGIDGYDVVFDSQGIVRRNGRCQAFSPTRESTSAPTFVEGWRFSSIAL